MKIAAVCVTYGRPLYLRRILRCFLEQQLPIEERELVILDDAGQYHHQRGPGWRLISVPWGFRTLGEKRNAAAALVAEDTEAIAVWDDDDFYFPWALRACAEALRRGEWVQPRHVLEVEEGRLVRQESFHRDYPVGRFAYHGSWAFRREFFVRCGGYMATHSGVEDQEFQARARTFGREGVFCPGLRPPRGEAPVHSVDIEEEPFYVYNRQGTRISEQRHTDDRYAAFHASGGLDLRPVPTLLPAADEEMPGWGREDIPSEVRPRAW